MIYEKLVDIYLNPQILKESNAELKSELIARGYKIVPASRDPRAKELWNHDALNPITTVEAAEEKLQYALIRLSRSFFALSSFMNQLKPVPNDPRVASAAVDRSGHLYYNTDFISKLTVGEIAGLIMHEICHIGMGDLFRSTELKSQADHKRMNIASDLVNNWSIMNDLETMNDDLPEGKDASISLPPGGCVPDPDGWVRRTALSQDEDIEFPQNDWIDLNLRSTEEVYEMLKKFDDVLIDILGNDTFDSHINATTINAVEIEERDSSGSSTPSPSGPVKSVPASLESVLAIDKHTGQPCVIVKADNDNKTALVVHISEEDMNNLKREFELNGLPI